MQPTSALANQVSNLVATDTTQLAAATAPKLHLAQAAFSPSLSLLIGNLTEATFTGYAAIAAGATGAQIRYFDPVTGNAIVEMKSPVGGWVFNCTSATGLPQTIFGYYLTDNGSATLYASALMPSGSITLTASGQSIEIANARLTFPPSPMT
jgi:hypothetical protein